MGGGRPWAAATRAKRRLACALGGAEGIELTPGTRPPTEVGARALRFCRPARAGVRAPHAETDSKEYTSMTSPLPYKVADLSLADFGRKEIELAEHEMPGLMAMRAEFGSPSRWPGLASPARCT